MHRRKRLEEAIADDARIRLDRGLDTMFELAREAKTWPATSSATSRLTRIRRPLETPCCWRRERRAQRHRHHPPGAGGTKARLAEMLLRMY